ncbi:diguanylate cyclase (GGDEF) domain-containing protein [Caloramator quimbayensis]|uniref:Diguanylate cyclase (GGDEF) domain-containing protein n=1 Tax=Caloramator quimbayensis TaxID=1147123 RepID=A0A1T4XD75_9CLOT|nr:GGDEF domain-containing protein [Caloramator quimbayensis]SKA87520.1 diguanylate cyclase (GGDEF) domain-containing protein [Caloramator quimbayensis]
MEKFLKADKIICILINQQGRIYYSNIDKDAAGKYLEDIHIFDHLPADYTINYNVGYYGITVDKVGLDEAEYYLILIQPQGNLYKYAYRDSFTGLYNRNYWEQLISGILHRPIPKRFTLIVIDVDNLKSLNDSRGHLAGDKAIRIVGQSIRESIRKQDIAIRYGGDEFFILLANTKKVIVEKVINRIKENIRKRGKKENIHIEISAGTACSDCTCEMEKVITIADNKMYKEKAGKKIKARQITDELMELKQKIEAVRDELKNKVIWKPNGSVDKELMEVNIKLEQMIKNYSKDEQ